MFGELINNFFYFFLIFFFKFLNNIDYFHGIYQALDDKIRITNFNYIDSSFCDAKFLITKAKKLKQRGTTFILNIWSWHKQV